MNKKVTTILLSVAALSFITNFVFQSSSLAASKTYINNSLLMLTVGAGGGVGGGLGGNGSGISNKVRYLPDNAFLSMSSSPSTHTCVVVYSGNIYCAGRNQSGELGSGNTASPQPTPVKFNFPTGLGASKVNGGSEYTCALLSDDQAYCSGVNDFGQLGNGATSSTQSTPVKFNLPVGLTAQTFSTGRDHTCALASDNQVYCAGSGGSGRLGSGTTANQSTPVKFNLPAGLTAQTTVNSSTFYTCALASDNQVYCAGSNSKGQLGNGATSSTQSTPVKFNLPAGLTAQTVSVGYDYTCALASDNQTYCAGDNSFGQLGNGATSSTQSTPVKFNLPAGLTAQTVAIMQSDKDHTCALASDNQVYCAGQNQYGEFGNGTTANQSTPVKFNLPAGLTAQTVGVGANHTCALASDNQVYCAGSGGSGRLGSGTTANQPTPVKFNLPAGLTAQAAGVGDIVTCALASDNELYCSGVNSEGQLGDGTTAIRSTPVEFQLP